MAKGIFVHRADSIYDDFPEERYQFPKRYLKRVSAVVGDWIAYYEPRGGGGRMGYNAIARVQEVIEDPSVADMYIAVIEAGSYLPLEKFVPYHTSDGFMESALSKDDGILNQGLIQWAVRPISDRDFLRILDIGFASEIETLPRVDNYTEEPGFAEGQEPFLYDDERTRVDQTISKISRSRVFRKHVLEAYDSRCAFTGLKLINGGGRAEVEAAHIQPVAHNGPDVVRNGIALSGTVHWMFDRGLISLSDQADILVSRYANDPDQIWNLVAKSKKASFPKTQALQPHPSYLLWHRENCFKH